MKDFFKIGLLTFGLIFSANAVAGWDVWLSKDQMTGEVTTVRADSSWTAPTIKRSSPYHELKAQIRIACWPKNDIAGIALSQPLTFDGEPLRVGSDYMDITTRIKWDDYISKVVLQHGKGSKLLTFKDPKNMVRELARSNTLLLELPSRSLGSVYFKFPLSGSNAALKELRAKCSKL